MGTSATRTAGGKLPPSRGVFRGLLALVALALLMALPSVSWAQNPSLDQYVESVPTSHGDRSPQGGSGGSHGGGSHLPSQTRQQIQQQGGSDAAALEAVATQANLGAPASDSGSGSGSGKKGRSGSGGGNGVGGGSGSGGSGATAGAGSPGAVNALATAATGGGDGSTGPWLLAALAALTGIALAVALRRRRHAG